MLNYVFISVAEYENASVSLLRLSVQTKPVLSTQALQSCRVRSQDSNSSDLEWCCSKSTQVYLKSRWPLTFLTVWKFAFPQHASSTSLVKAVFMSSVLASS